jgi:hypothetical protein
MSRVWLITGGAAPLAREISDRGGVAACSSFSGVWPGMSKLTSRMPRQAHSSARRANIAPDAPPPAKHSSVVSPSSSATLLCRYSTIGRPSAPSSMISASIVIGRVRSTASITSCKHVVVCSHPPQGRLRRAKPSSPAQHHVEKLYLQTELPSTFVAHVGSQVACHSTIPLNCGEASCLTRCHRAFVSNSCHFSGPIRNYPDGPAEVLGQRPGAFAQFRHVTAGIKQVLAKSPQRPLTGIFGSAQREEPQYP